MKVYHRYSLSYFFIIPVVLGVLYIPIYVPLRSISNDCNAIPGWVAWLSVTALTMLVYGITAIVNTIKVKRVTSEEELRTAVISLRGKKGRGFYGTALFCVSFGAFILSGVFTIFRDYFSSKHDAHAFYGAEIGFFIVAVLMLLPCICVSLVEQHVYFRKVSRLRGEATSDTDDNKGEPGTRIDIGGILTTQEEIKNEVFVA